MVILDRIVAAKKRELEDSRLRIPLDIIAEKCHQISTAVQENRCFARCLRKGTEIALIAEIKKASPSKGLIREDFDPREIAEIYCASGAAAISVLTDREFFRGSPEYLAIAKQVSVLPLLRKDFIIDIYQVYEARMLGADAILLIMAILSDAKVEKLMREAEKVGLECLVEVHTEVELKRALALNARIIGINNRDLSTFTTDLNTTFKLRGKIADSSVTIVSESGINTRADVLRLAEYGVHAMLVGEALMREQDIEHKIRELQGRETGGNEQI